MSRILVTGAAGFIGYHVTQAFLDRGDDVTGLDNLNPYYDVKLKRDRLERLRRYDRFEFAEIDLVDRDAMDALFERGGFEIVVNLAAQAGVRYSLTNPRAYIESNISGFVNVLEGCRRHPVKHLVYASSSSVYGANTRLPFSTSDNVDHPVSLYAASKKSNELMAHTYSHLFGIPTTGLRFFTVYGPWGRPDMALFIFTRAILADEEIELFNYGRMRRDFTYIADVVEGVVRVADRPATPDQSWSGDQPNPATSRAPYRIFNIGNHEPVELIDFLETLQKHLGKKARIRLTEMQPGDVPATFADVDDLQRAVNFAPRTNIDEGIRRFVEWYREYYNV